MISHKREEISVLEVLCKHNVPLLDFYSQKYIDVKKIIPFKQDPLNHINTVVTPTHEPRKAIF